MVENERKERLVGLWVPTDFMIRLHDGVARAWTDTEFGEWFWSANVGSAQTTGEARSEDEAKALATDAVASMNKMLERSKIR